jgi:hypothetical protein
MFNIFGRVKDLIIATLSIALPILYVLGRIKGKEAEKNKVLKDELQASEQANKFYKAMAEHEEDGSIATRSGLVERLRKDGL